VTRAEKLNVFCFERRSAAREWKNVIKVQFVGCTAFCALASIAFPNFYFDIRWNEALASVRKLLNFGCL